MCREGAWAELAAEVTFMVRIQSRTPGKKMNEENLAFRFLQKASFFLPIY